jgi:Ca2+-dependent lipid-binding protein
MDFFGKSDPFAKFYKFTTNKERILVYQTEVIKKTLEPTWKVWETTAEKLC